jgi:dephospho-CoA kinase
VLHDFPVEPGSTPPLTIALLGGIASGKSTVASLFEKRGAVVLDADKIAHEELESADVRGAVRAAWGDRILGADGKVDRRKLGSVVFQDPVELKKLEALVHPRVLAKIFSRLRELATPAGKARRVVVLDVPLAGETSLVKAADHVVFVDASLATRRKRALDLRHWSEGELERRESRQLSCEEKRALADAVVRNDQGVSEADQDVERFWTSVVGPRIQASR